MINELEGEFFVIRDSEEIWLYNTVCYGWEYDFNGKRYFLNTLVSDESNKEIWFEKVFDGEYEDEEFQKPDQRYYSKADKELIKRVFEYEWS